MSWIKRSIGWLFTLGVLYIFGKGFESFVFSSGLDLNGSLVMLFVGAAGRAGWFFLMIMVDKFDLMGDKENNEW